MKLIIMSALLLVCSTTVSAADADNPKPGWQSARTPSASGQSSSDVTAPPLSTQTTQPNGVPANQIQGPIPAPGQTNLVHEAATLDSDLSPDEIRSLRGLMSDNERAINAPLTSVVPRISSLTVNLSPGASLPLVRTARNHLSVVTFMDSNGSPWPQSDPPYNPAPKLFDVQFNDNMVTITPLQSWSSGNISVYLKGLPVPVLLNLNSGETDTNMASQEIDSRLDLRIPRIGPATPVNTTPAAKISLHDETLQAFLDGTPPADSNARRVKFTGNVPDTTIWQTGDELLVRSRAMLRDEFEQTLSSADGTHLWKLPLTPLLTFSVNGQSIPVTLEVE